MEKFTSTGQIENALFGKWDREDKALSMFFMFPSSDEEKGQVEFMVNTDNGTVNTTWEYEVMVKAEEKWIHFIDMTTAAIKPYTIVALEKNKRLQLHSADGHDLLFHPGKQQQQAQQR